jgi:orotate phosphoribosyltransferase
MKIKEESGLKVAEFLLQIKAIELNPESPFTWASGWKSPIYCDNRKSLSYPKVRTYLRQEFVNVINEQFGKPDAIVGVATGGIALGVLVAQDLGVPFAYVRASAKGHGLNNRIEGVVGENDTVVVVEDLVSTGKSSLDAVEALRDRGVNVKGMVAIFSYGFDVARENFNRASVPLAVLTDYETLMKQALKSGHVSENQIELLRSWRDNPSEWGVKV